MRLHMAAFSKPLRLFFVSILLALLVLPTQVRASHEAVIIEGIPSVTQWYNLSCEYAAAAAVTLFWGKLVSQSDFIREMPKHPNPHKGFRGNIYGSHGGTDDYGIYAKPLVPVLEKRGYKAKAVFEDAVWLRNEIDEGHPIVVWTTTGRNIPRQGFYQHYEGERYKLVPSEHAVVAYGYDSRGVYVMDVGDGGRYHTDWNSFLTRWGYFDGMALQIHP